MSHFTVTVRLTAKRLKKHALDVEKALAEILAPYDENTKNESFIEFEDEEDEFRAQYATEGHEMVRLEDGMYAHRSDDRFRVDPHTFGYGPDTHAIPPHLQLVEVPHKERYATFEEYVANAIGYTGPDPKTGRYGHWKCKQAKWDWYVVGGRWTGYFHVKKGRVAITGRPGLGDRIVEPGKADVVRPGDIDMDTTFEEQIADMKKFWLEWNELLGGKKFDDFRGPRGRALKIGLLRVEQKTVEAGPGEVVFPWSAYELIDERATWTDVATVVDEETFFKRYADHFDPLVTYAGLDDEGWFEPGQMGWWAVSRATPEDRDAYVKAFRDRIITPVQADDRLVLVDCHI